MRLFLRVVAGCVLLATASAHAADTDVPPGDAAAVRQVIRQQLDAFRKDDAPGAFAEASPGIQAQFGGDPQSFMEMVRRAYQPVYRPRSTAFGAAVVHGGQIVQKLELTSPDGGGHEALYYMEREKDGTWRIAGCVLTDDGSVGA